jgi:hypothetical protein
MNPLQSNKNLLDQHFGKKAILAQQQNENLFYSYDRVSSRDQMINGNSLGRQYERIDDFANKNSLFIKSRYVTNERNLKKNVGRYQKRGKRISHHCL